MHPPLSQSPVCPYLPSHYCLPSGGNRCHRLRVATHDSEGRTRRQRTAQLHPFRDSHTTIMHRRHNLGGSTGCNHRGLHQHTLQLHTWGEREGFLHGLVIVSSRQIQGRRFQRPLHPPAESDSIPRRDGASLRHAQRLHLPSFRGAHRRLHRLRRGIARIGHRKGEHASAGGGGCIGVKVHLLELQHRPYPLRIFHIVHNQHGGTTR